MASILPSLISADLLNLEASITELEPDAAGFHVDVMDFHFVPNLTWGPAFINAIRQATSKKIELHMMVDYPEQYLDRIELKKDDIFTFHPESKSNLSHHQLLKKIADIGLTPSIALNPQTPLEALIPLGSAFDRVLLMSVHPGFSGQKFLPATLNKLDALVRFRAAHDLSFTIAIDGGITEEIAQELIKHGADELAIATTIFSAENPKKMLKRLATIL